MSERESVCVCVYYICWTVSAVCLCMYARLCVREKTICTCSQRRLNLNLNPQLRRLDRDDTQGHGPETISLESFNKGDYVIRIDEYRGNPSAPNWAMSHAAVTYYSPHLGAITMEVGQQGYVAGRVWYVMFVDGETRSVLPCTRALCPERPAPAN